MPPIATGRYAWQPEPGTPEARLASDFLRPRDWADLPDAGDHAGDRADNGAEGRAGDPTAPPAPAGGTRV
jgi:hypothetical protein